MFLGRLLILFAALFSVAEGSAAGAAQWRQALPGYEYRFPRDHGAHPAFRTEWWYFSGNLTDGKGRRYAFMLTFFRTGLRPQEPKDPPRKSRWALRDLYFAHFSVLDAASGRHVYFERFSRGALEQAGAARGRMRVWLRDWHAESDGEGMYIAAREGDISVRLSLIPRKDPVIHGRNGVSQKAEGKGRASHYYSFTRLEAKGRLQLGKRHVPVTGTAWMDHEFGSNQLDEDQVGWDWLSLQLSDGRELMLYLMRKNNGTLDPHSSGTMVRKDGGTRHLPLSGFRMEATGKWESSRSGAVYPMGWRVWVPGEDMELTIRPISRDQEMETSGSTRVTYWEGGVTAEGTSGGHPVSGVGFVEMTGYAKRQRPKF